MRTVAQGNCARDAQIEAVRNVLGLTQKPL